MYDAFGVGTGSPADPFDGFGAQVGYFTDVETGLVLCTWRFYDPARGRWLTRDPIGYDGGINLYGYVRNNPVMWEDPTGKNPILYTVLGGLIIFGDIARHYYQTSGVIPLTKPETMHIARARVAVRKAGLPEIASRMHVIGKLRMDDVNTVTVIAAYHLPFEMANVPLGPCRHDIIVNDEFFVGRDGDARNHGDDPLRTLIHEAIHAFAGALYTNDTRPAAHERVDQWAEAWANAIRRGKKVRMPTNFREVIQNGVKAKY